MLAITGANGNLGRRLLRQVADMPARGLVRSAAAVRTLRALALPGDPAVVEVDYLDVEAMTGALAGCAQVVHLVGIIKETATNRYADAHERTAEVLVQAATRAGVRRIVCLSILGASESSGNACLRSRGAADAILLGAPMDVVVLRVPMVLGEEDYAARALAKRARQSFGVALRAGSLEQPIYAGDVIDAVCAALAGKVTGRAIVELAGPESLTRRQLTARAAAVLGRRSRTLSLPVGLGMALAALLERLGPNPPVTRAMLGVLDHDDHIDPGASAARLGISLTPLDTMLARCLGVAR
jgi:uncharacterized protein YbjT (DUF2867 family)